MNEIDFRNISSTFSNKEKAELRAIGTDVVIAFQTVDTKSENIKYKTEKEMCIQKKVYAALRILAIRIDNGETLESDLYEDNITVIKCDEFRYPVDKLEFEEYYISYLFEQISEDFVSDFNKYL